MFGKEFDLIIKIDFGFDVNFDMIFIRFKRGRGFKVGQNRSASREALRVIHYALAVATPLPLPTCPERVSRQQAIELRGQSRSQMEFGNEGKAAKELRPTLVSCYVRQLGDFE